MYEKECCYRAEHPPPPPGQGRARNVPSNFSGDGLQNGGMLIVQKGGVSVLLSHREEVPGDHIANATILRTLEIAEQVGPVAPSSSSSPGAGREAIRSATNQPEKEQ